MWYDNNSFYEYYCLNCDKHYKNLCNICLKLREHLYHIKLNIMTEIWLSNEEETFIQKIIKTKIIIMKKIIIKKNLKILKD